jgi:hypothetical protein
VVHPGGHEAPVGEPRDSRILLAARRIGGNQEFRAHFRAVDVEDLRADGRPVGIVVAPALVGPYRHEASVGERRNAGIVLAARRRGVDEELFARLASVRIKDLRADRCYPWVVGRIAGVTPYGDKPPVGEARDGGRELRIRRRRVDEDFGSPNDCTWHGRLPGRPLGPRFEEGGARRRMAFATAMCRRQ